MRGTCVKVCIGAEKVLLNGKTPSRMLQPVSQLHDRESRKVGEPHKRYSCSLTKPAICTSGQLWRAHDNHHVRQIQEGRLEKTNSH